MAQNRQEISGELYQMAQKAIQSDCQLDKLPTLKIKLIYSDDRKIYKLKVDNQKQFYVLKVRGVKAVKALDMSSEDLQKEYDLLVQAWQSGEQLPSNLSMSAPIAIWPEHKCILLSGCQGENLNDKFNQNLLKWSFDSGWLSSMIRQCGHWLGCFHQHSCQLGDIQDAIENRHKNLHRMLGVLAERPANPLSRTILESIETNFAKHTNHSENQLLGLVHGNFAYRNVLCNNQQLNLVDFEDAHIEHPGYDIGQFVAEIMFKSQFPWLRHKTNKLVTEFLTGYAEHQTLNKAIIQAYIGYHLVVHLYEHCTRGTQKFPNNLILSFRINFLAKLLKKWLTENS